MAECAACGHENRAEARFCDHCGSSLAAESEVLARSGRSYATSGAAVGDAVGAGRTETTSAARLAIVIGVRRIVDGQHMSLRAV